MDNDIFKVMLTKINLEDKIDNQNLIYYTDENTLPNITKNDQDILTNKLFKDLNQIVLEEMNRIFHKSYKKSFSLKLSQAWCNSGNDYLILEPHKHQNSILSAVYYPFSMDARITFLNPANSLNSILETKHIEKYDEYTREYYNEDVRTGDLLIFKSMMFHWIAPSKFDRYSIAYNSEVVYD